MLDITGDYNCVNYNTSVYTIDDLFFPFTLSILRRAWEKIEVDH